MTTENRVDIGPFGSQGVGFGEDVDPQSGGFEQASQWAEWARTMAMLANPTQEVIEQIVLLADFGKDGGKHGDYRRKAVVISFRLGARELTAPAFNRVGLLEAIEAEVERIEYFLANGELPKERPTRDPMGGAESEPYVRAMRAAARISAWTPDAALDRLTQLRVEGERIWDSILDDQAKGEWDDYTEVRRQMLVGVPIAKLMGKLPVHYQRGINACLSSTAGRQWLHNEALNGNTMDYSRNPEMALVAPNPMGIGKVGRKRNKQGSQDTED